MFGLRYHVASLAAVFLALAVGILLGVAISGKVSEVGERAERDRLSNLEQDVGEANERADAAERSGEAARELVESAYPALMANRLDDTQFALVFLGPVDGNVRSAVERTLFDAGAGGPAFMIALDIPLEPEELQSAIEGNDLLAGFADDGGDFGDLGRELGEEVIAGGDTPLWDTLQSELVQERTGAFSAEVDGAIVMYSWTPLGSEGEQEDAELASRDAATVSLAEGVVAGLDASDVPVVGVSTTGQPTALTDLYREQGISSVDDVETAAGRLALALLLAGGEPGHYGIKETATDGVTPPVDTVPSE
ncbi:MAG TPA: copper transporter [Gaiellaceae bacterium]|nr:copper transporter [Gaiellaceae bacterium]